MSGGRRLSRSTRPGDPRRMSVGALVIAAVPFLTLATGIRAPGDSESLVWEISTA